MTCDWCEKEATKAAKRPVRTIGPDYLKSCNDHERTIILLDYEFIPLAEAEMAEKRAALKK